VIEDTFFSFESDVHNYKGLYLPKIYAYGRPVTTFTGLMRQQWRYNYGDTQFMFYFLKKRPRKLNLRSPLWNIDYITHGFGLNYLSVMLLLFTAASIMIVFSNLPFVHLTIFNFIKPGNSTIYLEAFGAVAFVLSLFVPIILTKIYFKSIRKGFMIFLLNFALAVVRTRAAIAALLNRSPSWQWKREKTRKNSDILYSIHSTKYELVLSSGLFIFGYLALASKNMSGGIWLLFYGCLYLCATVMIYKYG
jgi:cellulose synthase/poly-beta-1,6-N-acetylglucosamine synthase-like glycosyltransferase